MIELRPFARLGHANHGWLDAHHHFSFAGYDDPHRMNWGALRVWNDDTIAPGTGFSRHGHRDMEIITYVREGAITHRDHLGNEGRTKAGDVQIMSAGRGILHEEYNLEADVTRIFQIWIAPAEIGVRPHWETATFPRIDRANKLVPLASGRDGDLMAGALALHQDAGVYGATLEPGANLAVDAAPDRYLYLVPTVGRVRVNGTEAGPRDGVAITDEERLVIEAARENGPAEFVLVDAPEMPQ